MVSSVGAVERPVELNENPHRLKALPVAEEDVAEEEGGGVVLADEQPVEDKKPFLGIGSQAVDETLATHLDLAHGVVVRTVHPGSGAAEAGLRKHDILLSIDEHQIDSPFALRDAVQSREVGDEIAVEIIREGKEQELSVTLGARPEGVPGVGNFSGGKLGGLKQIWPKGGVPGGAREQMEKIQEMLDKEFEELDGGALGLKLHEFFNEDLHEVLPKEGGR